MTRRFLSILACFAVVIGFAGAQPNQENLPNATMDFSGFLCSNSTNISTNPTKFIRLLDANNQVSLVVDSGANAQVPYTLFFTPNFGVTPGAGLLTAFGYVDFDLAGLGSLQVVIDGIGGLTLADLWLGKTEASGLRFLDLVVNAGPPGTFGTFQTLVLDPTSPNPGGLQTTAATEMRYPFVGPPPPPPPAPPCPAFPTAVPGVGDDTSTNVVFTMGQMIPFYGAVYTSCYVCSNGFVTFGAANSDLSESDIDMLNGPPRVAGNWDDLNPGSSGGGTVTYLETANTFQVAWVGVPEYFNTGIHDFCIQLYGMTALVPGLVTVSLGQVDDADSLTGISPGNASPVGPATGSSIDLSAMVNGGFYTGTPTEAIYQLFPSSGTKDIGWPWGAPSVDPCTGIPTGVPIPTIMNFTPNPGFTVPGDQGYTGT